MGRREHAAAKWDTKPIAGFRAWSIDVNLWAFITDLPPHQQAAANLMRITSAARDVAQAMTAQ